jgi:hydrogenase-4 component E
MSMTAGDFLAISSAVLAILLLGSGQLRLNLFLYSVQTMFLAAVTVWHSHSTHEVHLAVIALVVLLLKGIGVARFLGWLLGRIKIYNDPGTLLPIPLSMHTGVALFGIAYFLANRLPPPEINIYGSGGATAAISLLLSGALFMLTRKSALSQIIGFLTMENGIYLFALTQTHGMPMIVELGILLDVLVGVMISGLITFRIQKSFEHIDVSRLTELKD